MFLCHATMYGGWTVDFDLLDCLSLAGFEDMPTQITPGFQYPNAPGNI